MEGPHTRALAEQLNTLITGKPLERIIVPEGRWQANVLLLNCVGQVIQRIRSHGKWLFFDFSHGFTWLCQLITKSKWSVVTEQEAASVAAHGKRRPLLTVHLRS